MRNASSKLNKKGVGMDYIFKRAQLVSFGKRKITLYVKKRGGWS